MSSLHAITRTALAAVALAVALGMAAAPAAARNDTLDFSIDEAKSIGPSEKLSDLPLYFKGQKHAAVVKDFGVAKTNKRTNKFNKSDEHACSVALMSALIQLQTRARELQADAIVDITSVTKDTPLESATEYRCNLGTFVANVALTGRPVKFK